jgi:hypothetical protein
MSDRALPRCALAIYVPISESFTALNAALHRAAFKMARATSDFFKGYD